MGDVVFIGNDRPAERDLAAACRYACERNDAARGGLRQILGRPERRNLPRAGAALSLGALGGGGADHCARWNRRRHGALRRGSGSSRDRDLSRDPRPVRADDVLAHAEAAAGRSRALRSLLASVRAARRGAVPDPGQAGDDRLARPDRPRVLQRHRGPRPRHVRQRTMARRTRARSARPCTARCMSSTRR